MHERQSMLAHSLRVVQSIFRESIVKLLSRSSKWPKVRNDFLKTHSNCSACGGTNRLQVHHVEPFALDPSKELDPLNFICLCMGEFECHLRIGHGENFRAYNPSVREDAATVLANSESRSIIENLARKDRKKL